MCNRWYGKLLRLCDYIADLLKVCYDYGAVCTVMQKVAVPSPQGGVSTSQYTNNSLT